MCKHVAWFLVIRTCDTNYNLYWYCIYNYNIKEFY